MTTDEAIEELYNMMGLVTILEMKRKLPREITEDVTNGYRSALNHIMHVLREHKINEGIKKDGL